MREDDIDRIFDRFFQVGFGHRFKNVEKGEGEENEPPIVVNVKSDFGKRERNDDEEKTKMRNPPAVVVQDFGNMFHEIDRIMDELQRNLNTPVPSPIEFGRSNSSSNSELNYDDHDQSISSSPRDQVLKKTKQHSEEEERVLFESSLTRPQPFKSIFDNFFGHNESRNNNNPKQLDDNETLDQHQPISFSQSSSIQRIHRSDGSVEEVKTTRNSSGEEQRVVTRQIGNQKHSFIEENGNETEEIFENFDEKDLNEFNRKWTSQNQQQSEQESSPFEEKQSNQDTGFGFGLFKSYDNDNGNNNGAVESTTKPRPSMFNKLYDWWSQR